MTDIESGRWDSDGNSCDVAGIRLPEARKPEARVPGR